MSRAWRAATLADLSRLAGFTERLWGRHPYLGAHPGDLGWAFPRLADDVTLWMPGGNLRGWVWRGPADIDIQAAGPRERLELLRLVLRAAAEVDHVWVVTAAEEAEAAAQGWRVVMRTVPFFVGDLVSSESVPAPGGYRLETAAVRPDLGSRLDQLRSTGLPIAMTAKALARIRSTPLYTPELDIVIRSSHSGRVVGMAIGWLSLASGVGAIEPISVAPDCQGQGLGTALMYSLMEALRAHGARSCFMHAGTPAAVRTCRRVGWHVVGSRRRLRFDGGENSGRAPQRLE